MTDKGTGRRGAARGVDIILAAFPDAFDCDLAIEEARKIAVPAEVVAFAIGVASDPRIGITR